MHRFMTKPRCSITLLLILMVASLWITPNTLAHRHTSDDLKIISPHARVDGKTYGEWSARWWQWAFRLPISNSRGVFTHPLLVDGAVDCRYGQVGKVWFLGGTFVSNPDPKNNNVYVGNANRSCRIPAGTTLFFPILNAEADILGTDGKPQHNIRVHDLWKQVNDNMNRATDLGAQIDGRAVRDLKRYRVKSPIFALTMPKNNLYRYFDVPVAAGTYYPSVADGIFLMLAPLPVGKHTITFHGTSPGFRLNVTYRITVTASH